MLIYEPYNDNFTKVYSNQNFFIRYNGNHYESIILMKQEEISQVTETEIAIPSTSVTKDYLFNLIFPNFLNLSAQQAILGQETLIEILNQIDENLVYNVFFFFAPWTRGQYYKQGTRINYNNDIYEVLIQHTADFTPDQDNIHYQKIEKPLDMVEEWSNTKIPYQIGDKVKVRHYIYENLLNDNIWKPMDFPAGWKLLKGSQD